MNDPLNCHNYIYYGVIKSSYWRAYMFCLWHQTYTRNAIEITGVNTHIHAEVPCPAALGVLNCHFTVLTFWQMDQQTSTFDTYLTFTFLLQVQQSRIFFPCLCQTVLAANSSIGFSSRVLGARNVALVRRVFSFLGVLTLSLPRGQSHPAALAAPIWKQLLR